MKKDIGNVLREKRLNAGLTVQEVSSALIAKKYKASTKTIYSWENGNSQPSLKILLELCDMYDIKDILFTFGYDGYNEDDSIQLNIKEQDMVEKYRSLDPCGQEHVNTILDWEAARVQQLTKLEPRPAAIIDFQKRSNQTACTAEYFRSASAGGGVFILGNEGTSKIMVSESDWDDRVDYIISVSGHSMEPDYNDGDKVMVSQRMEMQHGDVGIFIINGKAYIKEYGEQELISRNPNSENIKISEHDNIVCMGKVIGKLKGTYKIIDD